MAKFTKAVVVPDDQVVVAIYLRASDPRPARAATDGRPAVEARQPHSLDHQRKVCEAYAVARGWIVVGVWQDGESGMNDDRRAYLEMLADKRWNTLLVWKCDRLGRDAAELFPVAKKLRTTGRRLVSATENVDDPLLMGMLFLLAEQESRLKSERVTPVMIKLAEEGRYVTRPSFGYRLVDKRLVIRPVAGARYIQATRRIFAGASTRQVILDWNRRGIKSPTGGQWDPSTLLRILRSPTPAGLIRWPGVDGLIKGQHTALISVDAWEALQAHLDLAGQAWSRVTSREPASLLVGFGKCACGASLCHHRSGPNSYLACRGKRHGQVCAIRGMLRMDSAEAAVRWVLEPVLGRSAPALLKHYAGATAVEHDAVADAVERARSRLMTELARVERQLDGLIDMRAAGEIDREQYQAKRAAYVDAKAQAEAALAALPEAQAAPEADPAATARRLASLGGLYDAGDAATRLANGRELLALLGVQVTREPEGMWVRVAPAWRRWTRGDVYFPLGGRGRKDGAPGRLLVPSGDDGNPYAPERTIEVGRLSAD